jgi:hypothetical protein
VRLSISGQNFTVRFSPERQTSESVAVRVCTDKANEIGVTQENYNNCVSNVGNYIQSYVDTWTSEKILSFPISINSTEFSVRFIPELRSAADMATEICSQYTKASGFNFENPATGCVEPIAGFIQRRIDNFYLEKTLELPLTVNNNFTFNIRFLPERQSPVDVATQLCVRYAQQLELTEETIRGNCIAPIANYLADQVDTWIRSKVLEFTFNINGESYTVSFLPERTSSVQVSQRFCLQNAEAFKLTNENFLASCVNPVNEYISKTIQEWVDSKRLTVPVSVNGQSTSITFVPERQPILYVARNFCLNQVDALKLNDDNFVQECVTPIMGVLRNGLTQWLQSARGEQQQQQQTQEPPRAPQPPGTATAGN